MFKETPLHTVICDCKFQILLPKLQVFFSKWHLHVQTLVLNGIQVIYWLYASLVLRIKLHPSVDMSSAKIVPLTAHKETITSKAHSVAALICTCSAPHS